MPIQFPNQPRDYEQSLNISVTVSKPIERLRYSRIIDKDSVATAYFESDSLNSSKNLILEDNSMSYEFNDRRNLDPQLFKKTDNLFWQSAYRDVLFTVFTGRNRHSEIVPLFYKQKIADDRRVGRVRIQRVTNSAEADDINYGFAIVDGNLYYNYQNEYNSVTGIYKFYTLNIQYTDGTSENCLINPIPAIEKARYDNLNEIRYTQQQLASGYRYRVLPPEGKTVAQLICSLDNSFELYVKELESNSIYLKIPEDRRVENEWFAEIVAGEVFKATDTEILRYHVPEYRNQNFSIEAPNLRIFNKDCWVVTPKVIKLPYSEISYSEDFTIEINVFDLNEEQLNDNPLAIASVDQKNGFVELEEQLNFQDGKDFYVRATFYYKTKTLFYNKINLNPFLNSENKDKKHYFYVKPNEDVASIVVEPTPQDEPTWLYLGAIYYQETCELEDSLSFDLKNEERFVSFRDALNKNPRLLQSKYGYGELGQVLQKNKVVVVNLPEEYEDHPEYTQDQLYELFKRKMRIDTNIIFNFVREECKLSLVEVTSNSVTLKASWEGPGEYEILLDDDVAFIYNQDIGNAPYYFDVTINGLNPNKTYELQTKYKGVLGKRLYEISTMGE